MIENSRLLSTTVDKGVGTITIVRAFQTVDVQPNSVVPVVSPMRIRTEIWGVVDGRLDLVSSVEEIAYNTSNLFIQDA